MIVQPYDLRYDKVLADNGVVLYKSPHDTPTMLMIGSDHGCAWWLISPFATRPEDRPNDWATYTLHVCDADNLFIEVIRHGDEKSEVVRTISVDYDDRKEDS